MANPGADQNNGEASFHQLIEAREEQKRLDKIPRSKMHEGERREARGGEERSDELKVN